MKKSILFITLILLCNCSDNSTDPHDDIKVKPIVLKSSTNYSDQLFEATFPNTEILNRIGEAYKQDYSESVKQSFISYIQNEVENLGEDKSLLNSCIDKTGCLHKEAITLPTYVEKAKYDGEDAWIIQLVWGMEPSDLGHYKCFVIGTNNLDILKLIRCK